MADIRINITADTKQAERNLKNLKDSASKAQTKQTDVQQAADKTAQAERGATEKATQLAGSLGILNQRFAGVAVGFSQLIATVKQLASSGISGIRGGIFAGLTTGLAGCAIALEALKKSAESAKEVLGRYSGNIAVNAKLASSDATANREQRQRVNAAWAEQMQMVSAAERGAQLTNEDLKRFARLSALTGYNTVGTTAEIRNARFASAQAQVAQAQADADKIRIANEAKIADSIRDAVTEIDRAYKESKFHEGGFSDWSGFLDYLGAQLGHVGDLVWNASGGAEQWQKMAQTLYKMPLENSASMLRSWATDNQLPTELQEKYLGLLEGIRTAQNEMRSVTSEAWNNLSAIQQADLEARIPNAGGVAGAGGLPAISASGSATSFERIGALASGFGANEAQDIARNVASQLMQTEQQSNVQRSILETIRAISNKGATFR